MCRLVYTRLKRGDVKVFKRFVLGLAYKSYDRGNKDGYFAAVKLTDGDVRVIRTVNFDRYVSFLENHNYSEAVLHLRMGTTGSVNENNVHGWMKQYAGKNWFVAHNGVVSGYSVTSRTTHVYDPKLNRWVSKTERFEDDRTDSEAMADKLVKFPTSMWEEVAGMKGFSGVMFFLEEKFRELLVLIGDGDEAFLFIARKGDTVIEGISSKKDILDTRYTRTVTKVIEVLGLKLYDERSKKLLELDSMTIGRLEFSVAFNLERSVAMDLPEAYPDVEVDEGELYELMKEEDDVTVNNAADDELYIYGWDDYVEVTRKGGSGKRKRKGRGWL